MGKFDIELNDYLSKMGFQVEKHDVAKVEKLLKAVIYRLVRNIMKNILSVMENTRDVEIDKKHIETTGRVCKKCVQRTTNTQHGGGIVLPMEYFTGVLTQHYTPDNFTDFQSTAANGHMARQGLDFSMARGGKPSDLTDSSFIKGFVQMVCIPKYFKDNKIKYKISKCAIKKIVTAVHENILIIFDHVYTNHCNKKTSSLQCLLNMTIFRNTVRSPEFSFLR